jgi:hypothetical protein
MVLRWELLGTVMGDDDAITAVVDRVAAARPFDETATAVVSLARKYLTGWRPSDFPFRSADPVVRQATNSPTMIFAPSLASGWPALLFRSVTTYEVDPVWAAQADVSGAEYHDRLTAFLGSIPVAKGIAALAEARGIPTDATGWKPDPDAQQFSGGAVQRLVLGPAEQPAAALRYAVFLAGDRGSVMKLITDIAVSPTEATDAKWGKLRLEEVRDALAAAVEGVGGHEADPMVRSIYSGEMPPRTTVELYIWSGAGESGGRPATTLNAMIDLEELGAATRPDLLPRQGMFAVAGTTPTATPQDRQNLVVHALIRMALDWGYLDARARLIPLALRGLLAMCLGPRGSRRAGSCSVTHKSAPGRGGRSSTTLPTVIDLDELGTPTRPDMLARRGMFAVAGTTPTATAWTAATLSFTR